MFIPQLTVRYNQGHPYILVGEPNNAYRKIRCAIGPAGMTHTKTEGDGATPIGAFALRQVYYRADKIVKPQTALPCTAIAKSDGWCDASEDKNYNKAVALPYPASAEAMWREDHLYNICVVLGHNDNPPIPYAGSAIFFHLSHPDYRPTEGCIGVKQEDMIETLKLCTPETMMHITP